MHLLHTLRTALRRSLILPCALGILHSPPARAAESAEPFATRAFAGLPVQYGGRIHPVDTLARNSLMLLRGKQVVAFTAEEAGFFTGKPAALTDAQKETFRKAGLPVDDKDVTDALAARPVAIAGRSLPADAWLAEVGFRPWIARHFRVFRIDNEEVQQLIGFKTADRNHFSWGEIEPHLARVAEAADRASQKESGTRTPFETGVMKLGRAAQQYHMLASLTFIPGDMPPGIPPIREYQVWLGTLNDLRTPSKTGGPAKIDAAAETLAVSLINRYRDMRRESRVGLVPPAAGEPADAPWNNLGAALLDVTQGRPLDAPGILPAYAELADAYRKGDNTTANAKVTELAGLYPDNQGGLNAAKVRAEHAFNRTEPFYQGTILYALAGLAVLGGWISVRRWPIRLGFWLLAAGTAVHTAGMLARMWIQDRPPVTNLYSSAVFVGWGAALLGLIVERFWKNGIGTTVAAIVGFASLIIAHNLGASGDDSMEVMRAVLDSNFWLATHVVVVTFGYSAMFVAGILAAIALVRRVVDRSFTAETEATITRAAYGSLCFAALTSFVGTMLGGVWADQSWGRFWGWDPKENGALLIVLWCAVALHARLGGLVSRAGFLQLLVAGNIVTAWSWFGTNLLSVGLHNYGFTDAAATALVAFVASQLLIIALGWIKPKNTSAAPSAPA